MGYLSQYELKVQTKSLSKKSISDRLEELKSLREEYANSIPSQEKLIDLMTKNLNRLKKIREQDIDDDSSEEAISWLREFSEGAAYALEENGNYNQECKWYSHREDLLTVSKVWPQLVFILDRTGESRGDIERLWFHNGQVESRQGVITFPNPPCW